MKSNSFTALFATFTLTLVLSAAPAEAKKYEGRLVPGSWEQSWNDTLKSKVFTDFFLSHKNDEVAKTICKNYQSKESQRKIFWHQLFVSLAYKESLHGPGNYVYFNGGINKGLYQVNPELNKAYGCSGDLYKANINIDCAAKMAKKLVRRDGGFLVGSKSGMAAYWQPLRSTSAYNRENRAFILDHVASACDSGRITYHTTKKQLTSEGRAQMLQDVDLNFNDVNDMGLSLDANPLSFRPYTIEEVEREWDESHQGEVIDDLRYHIRDDEQYENNNILNI